MKHILNIIAATSLTIGLAACNDKWEFNSTDTDKSGGLSLKSLIVDVANADGNPVGRASYVLDDFTVAVYDKTTGTMTGSKYTYKDMPDIITLPVGDYYVEVTSGAVQRAAFDAPYFTGVSADFAIADGEITEIGTVTCSLANIKVTVRYTDELAAIAGSDSKVTVIANDEGRLDYTLTETRAGYFEALEGSSTLVASFNGTINGVPENNIRRVYTDVKAGDHYIITFGINHNPGMDDEFGDVTLDGLQLDVTYTVEDVNGNITVDEDNLGGDDRPGKEDPKDPVTPDKPTPPVPGDYNPFDSDLKDGETYKVSDIKEAVVNIHTEAPITNLIVTIDSPSLTPEELEVVGLAGEFDLANPGDCESGLRALKLLNDDPILGATDVKFDITGLVPLLSAFPGEVHKFTITVKDNAGKSAAMTLSFQS